jgi:hypothetical protein
LLAGLRAKYGKQWPRHVERHREGGEILTVARDCGLGSGILSAANGCVVNATVPPPDTRKVLGAVGRNAESETGS